MTFTKGQRVRFVYRRQTIDATVMLASSNGKSLMLGFDRAVYDSSGGMYAGAMPVALNDDGKSYCNPADGEAVSIEPREAP